ncbi:MAG: hypothetical protein AB7H77_00400 [Bdellovibrionales bacterium]
MQQLNAYRFYELGAKLHALFNLRTQARVADMFAPLSEAQALLDGFIKGDPFTLEISREAANRLLGKLGSLFSRYYIDPNTRQLKSPSGEDRIDAHEISLVQSLVEKFEQTFAAELSRAPTYLAGKRGIYSTHDLAENARAIFSKEAQEVIPQAALVEFDAAGRALVFGFGTAAGMHLLRALEMTLKPYYEIFGTAAGPKSERNFAMYLKKLASLAEAENEEFRPDKRVVQMLAQIKDHYRNPIIAPENSVSLDDALSLFGMAGAVMNLMAAQLRRQPPDDGKKEGKTTVKAGADDHDEDESPADMRVSQAG